MSAAAAPLKAPFPYFGGKSRVASVVWDHLGNPANYVEPFFGSGAVLLGRPDEPRTETVNDANGMIVNFWRATQHAPDEVAHWADYPVFESDLHARHAWLTALVPDLSARLEGDPFYYHPQIAGWWVWGICAWIGGQWCASVGPWWPDEEGRLVKRSTAEGGIKRSRPIIERGGHGVHGITRQTPDLDGRGYGRGIHQRPQLDDAVRGVEKRLPHLSGGHGQGVIAKASEGVLNWFRALKNRLRHVRVCCGDWTRVVGPSATTGIGLTGIFFDPPYSMEAGRAMHCYSNESGTVAHDVRRYCIEHGSDPQKRIALAGYDTEHVELENYGWTCYAWKAAGGYGRGEDSRGLSNRDRERIWFSPHCLRPATADQLSMFEETI